jgi:hypothetical protein
MAMLRTSSHRVIINLLSWILLLTLLTGCQGINLAETNISPQSQEKAPEIRQAEITFEAVSPAKLAKGQNLYLEVLDEVTGLALNPIRTRLQGEDSQNFKTKIAFPVGSVIKYRYIHDNDPIGVEYSSQGQQVRYRLYTVDGPGIVHDTIAAWKSTPYNGGMGRIQGQVANKSNNSPVVNALVVAGGMQTLTASDGSFLMEGLPPGLHNLVIYSLDGSFRTFQQGAIVASNSTTPAVILLDSNKTVNITFRIHPPEDNPKGVPIRLIGNIFALGNTFADLRGGVNVVTSRAPLMAFQSDGTYLLTLKLPVGLDLRYKYTLGDGFWNAEHTSSGEIRVRQLIVPDNDSTVEDTIDTWKTANFGSVSFTVTVPDTTPISDTVSIQFNPFSWTEPIPMWPVGKNRWLYILYNPLNVFNSASYRYCRNDQCGTADALDTQGDKAQGKTFSPKDTDQALQDTVKEWAWLVLSTEPVVVSAGTIGARDANFQAGVEFLPGYHPSWQPYMTWAFQNVKEIGANTVMLTPTWHLTHKDPPVIAPVAGRDPLWFDLTQMAIQAQQKGLGITIHPVLRYPEDPQVWWQSAARDDGWWQSWFDRYHTFLLYHADLATQIGAKALVIGDESLLAALPGGTLADGSSSNVPGDINDRWHKLLVSIRARYSGKLVWMVPYAGKLPPVPDILKDDVDMLYIQISTPILTTDQPSQNDLEARLTAALDSDILKLQEQTNHPIILGLQFPSVSGAYDGCVDSSGTCLPSDAFLRPAPGYPSTQLSLNDQALVYSAALAAVNQRSWITGFYASGYFPPVELIDMSTSVRSKPAGDVLWYWFPRLLGQVAQ